MTKMRLIGIGLAAALALVAMAPATVLSADKGASIDPKKHAQGQKEAPAAVQAAGLKCVITDATFIGAGKDPATKAPASYYEVACQDGMGYVVGGPATHITATGCIDVSGPGPDGKPNALHCTLPANANPAAALTAFTKKGGSGCIVQKARYIGANATNVYYEAGCQDGSGYVVKTTAPPTIEGDSTIIPCYQLEPGGNLSCTMSDAASQLKIVDTLNTAANKGCVIKDRKYALSTKGGSDFFEVSCADGKGYMLEKKADGTLGRALDCVAADAMGLSCSMTDSRQAKTEQDSLYSRLARKAGYDCEVAKYAPFPLTANTPPGTEVVELQCSNRPDGAVAVFGQTNVVYDCAHSELAGYKCSFTPVELGFKPLQADLATLNKTDCQVSNWRAVGINSERTQGWSEVACSDGAQGYIIEYSLKPKITPTMAIVCSQAKGIGGGCKLPGNVKK
jgi:hypothetical protein